MQSKKFDGDHLDNAGGSNRGYLGNDIITRWENGMEEYDGRI